MSQPVSPHIDLRCSVRLTPLCARAQTGARWTDPTPGVGGGWGTNARFVAGARAMGWTVERLPRGALLACPACTAVLPPRERWTELPLAG